jgi:hypothetical protein
MESATKDLRIGQSLCELERLRGALKQWQEDRKLADKHKDGSYRGQYQTQVGVVVDEVGRAISTMTTAITQLAKDASTQTLSAVYQKCARIDRQVIWLWRAWDYFREKFDQRDLPGIGPALRAADEVLWSCFKPFFVGTGQNRPPAPLPYVEFTYSPMAVRPDQISHVEKDEEMEEGPLKPFFTRLPVPLLQLPPTAVSTPWAHVLIGHETGHFIQEFVPAKRDYRNIFREQVQAAAEQIQPGQGPVWGKWAAEIFADMHSVITMGPWAVWVMGQFELARPGKITTRATNYPSALTRIYLLAQFASRAGVGDPDVLLQDLGIDLNTAADTGDAHTDLKIAAKVALLINEPLPDDNRSLCEVIGLSLSDYQSEKGLRQAGAVEQWAKALTGEAPKQNDEDLRSARMVAAGAAQAWTMIAAMSSDSARKKATATLRAQAFPHMIACAEAGTRGASAPAAEAGPSLGDILQNMTDEELFR